MTDQEILGRIHDLVAEEHGLRERYERHELTEGEEHDRLQALEVALDQCWDLLRQRRARTAAGASADGASVRPAGEVEGYLQ